MKIKVQLSVMMFLQFFIWGGWFVTMGSYLSNTLHASGAQIGAAYSTQSWGAILAPFIIGLIADRYFNAERVLAVLHLAGSVLLYLAARSASFDGFFPYLLAYMMLYMPTLALVNSVSFRQLQDPSQEFSRLRVWGTVGWIVAGLAISYGFSWDAPDAIAAGRLGNTFLMCAGASLLPGVFSLALPATPPAGQAESRGLRDIIGLDALRLLADRNFLVFFVSSVLICIPLAFYYQNTNLFLTELHVANATGKQTIGQMSEVLFMLLLPIFLGRFGMKITLLVGILAWALRYVLFAFGDAGSGVALLLIGIALHGVCYDFFFVSGQIYIDSKAGKNIKSAAQGMITLATYGVGMLIGFRAAGWATDLHATAGTHDWKPIWLYAAAFAAVVFVIFSLSFRNESVQYRKS
ncbi:MAG: nucleoside permease [Steroidobacteraceae bacterium]